MYELDLSNVTMIGQFAFTGAKIKEVNLSNVSSFDGIAAFSDCNELTKVILPDKSVNGIADAYIFGNPVYDVGEYLSNITYISYNGSVYSSVNEFYEAIGAETYTIE